jgi:hypothetical protein
LAHLRAYKIWNAKNLTDEEKASLQFEARVSRGSTEILAGLAESAQVLFKEAANKMSGKQLVILILGSAVAITSGILINADLDRSAEIKKLEIASQERLQTLATLKGFSEQETARMKVLQEAFGQEPKLREVEGLMQAPREKFLRNVPSEADIKFQGVEIHGSLANELARKSRRQGHVVTLRGHFQIIEIDSRRD